MKHASSLRCRAGRGALLAAASLAAACAQLPSEPLVHPPMPARAEAPALGLRAPGGIFQTGSHGSALFEDGKPRRAGDILTVVINEQVNASKNSSTNATRTGTTAVSFGTTPKLLGGLLAGQDAAMSGANTLAAKGGANAANTFTGVITVTVVDVLPNGNLLVSGEKQMLINQGTEVIRFSGVVDPRNVLGDGTVLSRQVADAKIEYSGKGYINEAQTMGWLQRFFLNVMPF